MKLQFTPIVFPDHTDPVGQLSADFRSQACWYFYLHAQKMKEKVAGGDTEQQFGLLDGELWMDTHYVQLAQTVALMYGLASPDEFAKAWDEVRKEAQVSGLPIPHPSYTNLARIVVQ